jgi:predicted Zn-dependent peptidase
VLVDWPEPQIGEYRNGVPAATGARKTPRAAKVTTLANGLRVASLTSSDIGVALGLFVGVGSRNETRSNAGATHFLKYAAFNSSKAKPGYQVVRELETASASFTSTTGREHILFSSELPADSVDTVLPIISDLLNPKLAYHEVQAQGNAVQEEVDRLEGDTVTTLFELVHRQAYRNRGLGQSLIASKDNIHHINQDTLTKFVHANYTPDQSVLVVVGM